MQAINYTQLRTLLPFDSSYDRREHRPRFKSIVSALIRMNYTDKAFGIYNEFGLFCVVAADHLQDALDIAVDENCMDSCLVPFDELDAYQRKQLERGEGVDDLTPLGNASELFDLTYIQCRELER